MKNFVSFLRRGTLTIEPTYLYIRGAKKKKDGPGASGEEASDDLINIFKDKKDPEIKPLSEYPLWLTEMLYPMKSMETVMHSWMHGDHLGYPTMRNLKTMMGQIHRAKIKEGNFYKKFVHGDADDENIEDFERNQIGVADEDIAFEQQQQKEAEEAAEQEDEEE